jgi:hypothetical protein
LGLNFNPTNQPTTDDGDKVDGPNDGIRLMDGLYLYTPDLDRYLMDRNKEGWNREKE